jgi:hypothetical protein
MDAGPGERLSAHVVIYAIFLILFSALIWVGVAFAGYALYLSVLTQMAAPGAAAVSAVVLVTGPLGWAGIMKWRLPKASQPLGAEDARAAPAATQDAMLSLLAKVAQDKPLLAVVFAGILGASEAVLHRRD